MTYSVIIKKENGCTIGFTGVKEIIESPIGYHFEFGGRSHLFMYKSTIESIEISEDLR